MDTGEQIAAKRTFEEVVGAMEMTDQEKRALDTTERLAGKPALAPDENALPVVRSDLPPWAILPTGMPVPAGKQLVAVRFRADWTDKPRLGDRHCILWNLTDADEKLALKRTRGEHLRSMDELAKGMIRTIDGMRIDWVMPGPNNVDQFWDDIGGACRSQIKALYHKRHTLKTSELIDFLADCVAVATVSG